MIAETATGVELDVRVIPRAKKSCLGARHKRVAVDGLARDLAKAHLGL